MKKRRLNYVYAAAIIFVFSSCGPRTEPATDTTEKLPEIEISVFAHESYGEFFKNLSSLCGQSFGGRQVYMQEGRESWEDKEMLMHVTVCEPDELHIPFHLNGDRSRTWMFFNEDGQLRFRHDHRHEDGTPEDMTMYGGYADPERGSAFYQVFPADNYTIDIHPISIDSEWVVELSDDLSVFSYQLHHEGEMIFRADFDLSSPLK